MYTLRDTDGFYDNLNKTFSIPKDWVGFTKLDNSAVGCAGGSNHPGNSHRVNRRDEDAEMPEKIKGDGMQKRCRRTGFRFYGIPPGKTDYDMPNPKDAILKSMPKMLDLQIQIAARQADLALGNFNGTVSDISQALSLPVFMMAESIDKMN